MVIRRGCIYWAQVDGRRPVLVVQAQPYNDSRLPTVLGAVLTTDTKVATMPGNVFVPAATSGLPDDAVVNVAVLVTLDKARLSGPIGEIPATELSTVDGGLRRVLGLST
jgi:mRNA interferase MazF